MIIKQHIFSENLRDVSRLNLFVNDPNTGHEDWHILYDIHLPNGQRVHIVAGCALDDMFVWNNAIVIGENMLEVLE